MCETDMLLPVMTIKAQRLLKSRVMNWDFRNQVYRKKPLLTVEEKKKYLMMQWNVAAIWDIARYNSRKNMILAPLTGLLSLGLAGAAIMMPAPILVRSLTGLVSLAGLWAARQYHREGKIHRWSVKESDRLLTQLEKGENIPPPDRDLAENAWFRFQECTLMGVVSSAFNLRLSMGAEAYPIWLKKHQAKAKGRE